MEIKKTQALVMEALTSNEKTRNSDSYLYYTVSKMVLEQAGVNIDTLSFKDCMLRRKELNLPKFETVRRTRQKIQQHHPELCGNDDVEAARELNEEAYREYARGTV